MIQHWLNYLPASPQCGALSEGVGEACSQPQHQEIPLPQITHPFLLHTDITQLCQIQHNCESQREETMLRLTAVASQLTNCCTEQPTSLLALPPQSQDQRVQADGLELNQVLGFIEHGLLPFLHVLHGHKQAAGHVEEFPRDAVCGNDTASGAAVCKCGIV